MSAKSLLGVRVVGIVANSISICQKRMALVRWRDATNNRRVDKMSVGEKREGSINVVVAAKDMSKASYILMTMRLILGKIVLCVMENSYSRVMFCAAVMGSTKGCCAVVVLFEGGVWFGITAHCPSWVLGGSLMVLNM